VACLFALPHIIRNVLSFLPQVYVNAATTPLAISLSIILSLLLTVLMLLLGVTSFKIIKEKMHTLAWKRLQLLAYPFFIGIYLHCALLLLHPALNGGRDAFEHLIAYTIIFVLYCILRIKKALGSSRSVKRISSNQLNQAKVDSNGSLHVEPSNNS
jgi:DMSO/TMAO reductase YedYZ heme-binding membrane subunit